MMMLSFNSFIHMIYYPCTLRQHLLDSWYCLVEDFPSAFSCGQTQQEAIEKARIEIESQLKHLSFENRPFPKPSAQKVYQSLIGVDLSWAEVADTCNSCVDLVSRRDQFKEMGTL